MSFTVQFQRVRDNFWVRVAWRVIKEVSVPLVVAGVLAWYSMKAKTGWNWADFFQVFSTTFVAAGFFTAYLMRSHKLVTDEDRHSNVISKQESLLKKMEESVRLIDGHATGGDSFAILNHAEVKDFGVRKALQKMQFLVVGEFPLHDVRLKIWNRDDTSVHELIAAKDSTFEHDPLRMGDMLLDVTYKGELEIVFLNGRTNRIDLTWYSRNGTWFQRFEIKAVGDGYEMATFVVRGEKEIYVKALTGYECDADGRPLFDLSPSPLDTSHPVIVKAL